MVRSISIYQPRSGIGEREFNQCHIISKHRKNKIFATQEEEEEEEEAVALQEMGID